MAEHLYEMAERIRKGDREALLAVLRELYSASDPEDAHAVADGALLGFIGDDEIAAAFLALERWYA